LRPDAGALARLLEHSTRLAGRRDKLSAGFSELLDVMQEADRVARDRLAPAATAKKTRARAKPGALEREDVEAAIARRRRRHDLNERRVQEDLLEGAVRIDTAGVRPGAVNALVVYDQGDHVFSRPARISATVGAGKRGVVDVERESGLSGDLHTKGVQVLSGLLRGLYAQDQPLGFTATICFEQSHGPIDGDSASAAEAIALISALSGLPVRQDLAITGAVSQHGELVAIGSPTAKVEGFFAVCWARGLSGTQGALIPASSAGDLVLAAPVVEAVEQGKFRVTALESLDQALELLLSTPAGTRDGAGAPWTPGSVHARTQSAVRELYLASRPPRRVRVESESRPRK
jgi:predicted ATP-dependent protease